MGRATCLRSRQSARGRRQLLGQRQPRGGGGSGGWSRLSPAVAEGRSTGTDERIAHQASAPGTWGAWFDAQRAQTAPGSLPTCC